jgi:hypothetical protein
MAGNVVPTAIALSIALLTASHVCAQTTRAEALEQQKAEKAAQIQPQARESGDTILDKFGSLFMPDPPAMELSFGGLRPGAGLAPGIAYVVPIGERALWTTKASWSLHNFKLAESTLELTKLARNRVDVEARVRWDDAPQIAFFGLGAGTRSGDEVSYGLRTSEMGADAVVHLVHWLRFGGGIAYLDVASENGAGPLPPVGSIFTEVSAPSLGSNSSWLHSTASVAIDNRESPGYTRRGGLYQVTFHDYSDRGGRYSFNRTEVDLRQFAPLLHDNWIIALQARADLTDADDQAIPYFMLPYLRRRYAARVFPIPVHRPKQSPAPW